MNRRNGIVHRGFWWPEVVVPSATFAIAWQISRNVFVSIGALMVAVAVIFLIKPWRPGRWTE